MKIKTLCCLGALLVAAPAWAGSPQPGVKQMESLKALLTEAEGLMAKAAAEDDPAPVGFGGIEHPELYERAQALFEAALKLAPTSKRAQEGVANCQEMLTPLIPVQHLAPPHVGIFEIKPALGEAPATKPAARLSPWEERRAMRAQQRRGMAYTGEVFSQEEARLKAEAAAMIEAARLRVASGALTAEAAYAETEAKLKALRQAADQSWKGHGPDFYPEAIDSLKSALKLL